MSSRAWLDEIFGVLFAAPTAEFGRFERLGGWQEVIADTVHRCECHRAGDEADRYELTLFHPIRGLAAELWEHEVRSLVSLSGMSHASLPEIVDGGSDDDWQIAFSRTRSEGSIVEPARAIASLRRDPIEALRQFDSVLDGLRRIHDNRLLHRNICPDAFRFVREEADAEGVIVRPARIVLARFEMSTLISNLVRGSSVDIAASARQLRTLLGGPEDEHLRGRHRAYIAPERASFVFADDGLAPRDWDTTDLFGLGVLAFELFLGDLDALDEYGELRTDGTAAAHERLRQRMRSQTTRRRDLDGRNVPGPICELIAGLLEDDPRSRWNAHRAATHLEEGWGELTGFWHSETDEPPLLVAFMPRESAVTLYEQRQWLSVSPTEPAGRDELQIWLERELRNAEIVHSPRGAIGYAKHRNEDALKQAEWALIGERAVWFCAYLRVGDKREERVLVIKFVRERERAADLLRLRPRRRLDQIELFGWQVGQSVDHRVDGRPSWTPLLEEVRHRRVGSQEDLQFLDALDFLLRYQATELDAREYAVTVHAQNGSSTVLRVDHDREADRRHRDPLLSAFALDTRRRPPLASFIESLDDDLQAPKLQVAPDRRGRGAWRSSAQVSVRPSSSGDVDVIEVTGGEGLVDGQSYWLRASDDRWSWVALDRQIRARPALELRPTLVSKLRNPVSMTIGRQRWTGIDPRLEGEAPDIVCDILSSFPIHAVQGPPGTGKTRVAAEALKLYLEHEPAARVLVSAQSHYALDNLGLRIITVLDEVGIDADVLREVPAGYDLDRLPPLMRRHTLPELTSATIRRILADVDGRLASDAVVVLSTSERRVLAEWTKSVAADDIEIAYRLRRSASVVLATCSTAAARFFGDVDPSSAFDWAIIEEAAKAWPTEVVMPLLLAHRWTLIGDHRQLGAFRREDVEAFLASISTQAEDEILEHAKNAGSSDFSGE